MSDILPSDEPTEGEILPQVLFRPQARADLKEVFIFVAGNDLEAGMRFLEAARATLENLAAMPLIGTPRIFRNARLSGIRQWPVQGFRKYLIFYRSLPDATGIEIIRLLHTAREIEAALDNDS